MKIKWLQKIETELNAITATELDLGKPIAMIDDEEDYIVGTVVNEDLMKLYILGYNYVTRVKNTFDALETLKIENNCKNGPEMCTEGCKKKCSMMQYEIENLREQTNAIFKIFWDSLRFEFNLWGKTTIKICAGWKVAWCDDEDIPSMMELLGLAIPSGPLRKTPSTLH